MATKKASTKAKKSNRDSYAGIPQSARAEVARSLNSFRKMFSPQAVFQDMQETEKCKEKKEEVKKAWALHKRAQEERGTLSQEGMAEVRMAFGKVYSRMNEICLHVGLLKAGVEGDLPDRYIDEEDLRKSCARAAYEAVNTMLSDLSDLEGLFNLGDEPLGDEIRRAGEMEAAHG